MGVPDGDGNVHAGDHGEAAEGDHGEEQGLQPRHTLYQVERSGRTKHNTYKMSRYQRTYAKDTRYAAKCIKYCTIYREIPTNTNMTDCNSSI
jgi:hypothetical protein